MTTAALYARCSTGGQTVEPQVLALRAYAAARGLEVVEVYRDSGVSGAKRERPGLDRLLADARAGRFDAIVVQKLDRLGRSLHHLLDLLGELERIGVGFVSVDDAIDTSTPAGRLFMQIRGAFAEYERTLIVERVNTGLAAARARGQRLGRPSISRDVVESARRMRARGVSWREAARATGASVNALRRALAA
jgi:DNA invertase Pin-like site-specific DNA recombinase